MVQELNAYELKALNYELLLKDILTAAEKLSPFPDVAWKVLGLIRKMASVKEIEAVIKFDPTIAARVLSLSQSAYYQRLRKVTSLQEAIMVLGNQKLVEVILAACAVHYFRGQISGYRLNEQALWRHSVAVAIMAEKLAQEFRKKKVLTAYTAGLLHDIGKTVLDLYAKIYLHVDLSQIRKGGVQFIEVERRALGIDHQELGQIIARRWQFPVEVTVAIGNHHFPQKAKTDQDMAAIVYAADRMVNAMEGDEGCRDVLDAASDPVFKAMGIDAQRVERFQAELTEALEGIVTFLKNDA